MILDLGQRLDLEWIRITAEYSNAVLVAMMPYVSNAVEKLDLPVPRPVTMEQVSYCNIAPQRMLSVEMGIKGGWDFRFSDGYVCAVQGPRHFFGIQDFDRIPEFFGETKITRDQAVRLARDTLGKLDVSLESVFAEQEPNVTGPLPNGTNTVPHYLVEWFDPRAVGQAPACVRIEIDGQANQVQQVRFLSSLKSLKRPPPKIAIEPPPDPRYRAWPQTNPDYAWKLIPIALQAVDEYARTLSLPIPRPLTTNHLARFSLADNGGWPHSEIELTNGWTFIYRNRMVNGYYAPDNFFNSDDRPISIKDFTGKWNMSEAEAIALIRRTLAKLNYPTNLLRMEFAPQLIKPSVPGIPRYSFWWWCENETKQDLVSKVEAEVDADKRELKSLYFDNTAFWNKPPPIDVPLTLPRSDATNAASAMERGATRKAISRPFKPFIAPKEN